MTQAYSDPSREADTYSLPDVEVFWLSASEAGAIDGPADDWSEPLPEGWYWHSCFPGCLPDGEPSGPFATEADALADAQDI